MGVIIILILASLTLATTFLFGFIWAVRSGQFEDTHTPSMRVLMDDPGSSQNLSVPKPKSDANPT